ncbi:glucose PTS transporter subunit IIA [Spiroplasma endosymbiont of Cantharis rufa]|uniref:PTS glucose transporter subunit IIABC n=1 Tax=Spiroplasma endosymbiont of Cantharis rufa TaxID=3066279 RepID=UPI0030D1535D
MSIKIYAPVDCEVRQIKKCSDNAFANKLLGDGILIIPKDNLFFSPFSQATVKMIFDTKHAYGFEVDGYNVLIHCGLDSIKLNGKYFETNLEVNQEVNLDTKIFSVEINKLRKLNISKETPIVFEDPNIIIPVFEEKIYKKGELICEINTERIEIKEEENLDPYVFFATDSKYISAARTINEFVGTMENYTSVYNCMTRLRFKIKDKSKVDIEKLKHNNNVKGVVWNNDELQVIIGQDVYKLKNAFTEINQSVDVNFELKKKLKSKKSWFLQMLSAIIAITIRVLPFLIGVGLLQAMVSILQQTGWMPSITFDPSSANEETIYLLNAPVIWAMLFVIARTSIVMLAILFAWAASDYFKLRPIIGLGIAVILCSPYLFVTGGPNGMGEYIVMFRFWDQPIDKTRPITLFLNQLSEVRLNGMNTKPFVILPAIILAKKLDDSILEWMPPSLELMGRPFLIFLITLPVTFLIFSPLWNIFESILAISVFYIKALPFGLGIGLYVASWQVAIIFGLHNVLSIVQFIDHLVNGGQSEIGVAGGISLFAQFGALIAVILVTKNIKLRNQGLGLISAGIIGITEPILYQINLPKRRPLYSGLIAAFVFGTISGMLGVARRGGSGLGIFELIGYFSEPMLGGYSEISPLANGLMYTGCCLGSFFLAAIICYFWFRERKTEKVLIKETTKDLVKLIALQEGKATKEIKVELKKINKLLNKFNNKNIKNYEIKIQNLIFIRTKIAKLISQQEKVKEKTLLLGKKLMADNKVEQANKLISKYKISNKKYDVSEWKEKLEVAQKEINFEALDKLISNNLSTLLAILRKFEKQIGADKISHIKNNYYNALNALRINYELDIERDNILDFKKEFRNLRG